MKLSLRNVNLSLAIYSIVATCLILMLIMSRPPASKENYYQQKAKDVQACVDAGGEWYNSPGWGENCNFDTRKVKP
jgi:hypothetical protein